MNSPAFRADLTGRRRVVVAGWFGSGNFGDELLLYALKSSVMNAHPEVDVTVLAADPERVHRLHACDSYGLPVLRGENGGWRAARTAHRVLRGADLLILGPGTIFQERSDVLRWPGTLPMLTRLVALSRFSGTPVAVLGAGVREGETPFGRVLLRAMASLASEIAVRDAQSASKFGGTARVSGDIAMACTHVPDGSTPKPSGYGSFLLSMRPLAESVEQRLASTLSEVVRHLEGLGLNGAFMPMSHGYGANREDDREVYEQYFEQLLPISAAHLEQSEFGSLSNEWFALLARQELMVATRLHAALPSVMCGVPTVAIAYERKVAETLKQLGLGAYVVHPLAPAEDFIRICDAALSASGRRDFARAREETARRGRDARRLIARMTSPRL